MIPIRNGRPTGHASLSSRIVLVRSLRATETMTYGSYPRPVARLRGFLITKKTTIIRDGHQTDRPSPSPANFTTAIILRYGSRRLKAATPQNLLPVTPIL